LFVGGRVVSIAGRVVFKNKEILESVRADQLVPMRYADDLGRSTTEYPMNPNGSVDGIAALCSSDGRHLAMMPHPERCVMTWQWPWMPSDWRQSMDTSPWLCMFKNAFNWCLDPDAQGRAVGRN
jgi:phosphoribosylformylglycinamidine synthase